MMPARRFLPVVAVCLLLLPVTWAAPPNNKTKKPEPPFSLEAVHQAIGKEDYETAKRQADALLKMKTTPAADRTRLVRAYGRILLGLGDTAQARGYLQKMATAKLQGEDLQLMKVYAAWLEAQNGNVQRAVDLLQTLVHDDAETVSAAEAADVLAILRLQQDDREKAKAAVAHGLHILDYYELDTPYVGQLLRGRLTSKWGLKNANNDAAEKLYEQAEALRRQENFREAGKLYAQLRAQYPDSTWRHPAGYRIGQCLAGLKLYDRAEAHWAGLVNADPDGPWRGQSQLARIDLALEQRFDLATAAKLVQSAADVLERGVAADAEPSWTEAAVELWLREGTLALIAKRYDAAMPALQSADAAVAAKRGHSNETLLRGIGRLAELARQQQDLLPSGLGDGDPRASLASALGSANLLLQRYEKAQTFFNRVLTGPARSASPAHLSFAALGMARIYRAQDDLDNAQRGYQFSLSQDPAGSWHDETLRELALLIEQQAAAKFGHTATSNASEHPDETVEAAQRNKDAQRLKSKDWIGARHAALPYWVRLLQEFPNSRHVPQALFHAGVLYVEADQPEAAEKAFKQLTANHPASPWTGDAHVWLIDVNLERHFDLAGARRHAKEAIAWLGNLDEPSVAKARGSLDSDDAAVVRTLREVCYDVYVRAGVIEYLDQQHDHAIVMFEKAAEFAPDQNLQVAFGHVPSAIERLIEAAKSGTSITPEVVLEGDDTAKLILLLADLYHAGHQYEKALELCDRVVEGAAPRATAEQTSWAHFKRGRNFYCLEDEQRQPETAYQDYLVAAKAAPRTDWADDALFLAANIRWNHFRDAEGAIALWKQLLKTYPNSNEADRSHYFIGVAYEWSGRKTDAKRVYEEFLKQRTASVFANVARSQLAGILESERGK